MVAERKSDNTGTNTGWHTDLTQMGPQSGGGAEWCNSYLINFFWEKDKNAQEIPS